LSSGRSESKFNKSALTGKDFWQINGLKAGNMRNPSHGFVGAYTEKSISWSAEKQTQYQAWIDWATKQADRLDPFVSEKPASLLDLLNKSVLCHVFPVISPVISLLVPCYDCRPGITYFSIYAAIDATGIHPGRTEMRKGSTREPKRDDPATPVKNYITPNGLQRLKDEHRFLLTRERPAMTEVVAWAASNGDRSENADYQYGKRRLRQIDGRIRFLTKRIEAAEVVDPEAPRAGQAATRAFFGATVRYANAAGAERVVSIVGTDEIDLNRNHISWVSPLARALMKSAAGDSVVIQLPGGTEYLTVLEVCYERISVEPFREPAGAEASAKGLPRQR
jgi:transcription elongation factor GreB